MWTDIKRLLGVGFRLLAALFMLVVIFGVVYWAWTSWQTRKIEARTSIAKSWNVAALPLRKPLEIRLVTRCSNSRLYYQLALAPKTEAAGNPKSLENALFVDEILKGIAKYEVAFMDGDGFKTMTLTLTTSSFARDVDAQGKATGLSANGDNYCDPATYEKAVFANVLWPK